MGRASLLAANFALSVSLVHFNSNSTFFSRLLCAMSLTILACSKENFQKMDTRITNLEEKKLVGMRCSMTYSQNKTKELWQRFGPVIDRIHNRVGSNLYSAEVFDPSFFENFDPAKEFEKWAAVEVTDFNSVPDEMETIVFPDGLYAVFLHKGPASAAPKTYRYIYEEWIPNSAFSLDDKPHFAIMGEKYEPNSQDSEEEVWIPIKN